MDIAVKEQTRTIVSSMKVVAGDEPGKPDERHTREFTWKTTQTLTKAGIITTMTAVQLVDFYDKIGAGLAYAQQLCYPEIAKWVSVEWTYQPEDADKGSV